MNGIKMTVTGGSDFKLRLSTTGLVKDRFSSLILGGKKIPYRDKGELVHQTRKLY